MFYWVDSGLRETTPACGPTILLSKIGFRWGAILHGRGNRFDTLAVFGTSLFQSGSWATLRGSARRLKTKSSEFLSTRSAYCSPYIVKAQAGVDLRTPDLGSLGRLLPFRRQGFLRWILPRGRCGAKELNNFALGGEKEHLYGKKKSGNTKKHAQERAERTRRHADHTYDDA